MQISTNEAVKIYQQNQNNNITKKIVNQSDNVTVEKDTKQTQNELSNEEKRLEVEKKIKEFGYDKNKDLTYNYNDQKGKLLNLNI